MASFHRSMLGLGLAVLAAQACGGTSGSNGNAAAGSGGSSGSVSNTAGGAGNGGGGARNGGTASAGTASAGAGTAGAGTASAGAGTAGAGDAGAGDAGAGGTSSGGAQTADSVTCETVDDCVIATVFGSSGCCARTDCGTALNRDWVLNEPCASSDESTDPVPASCSQGCNLCPASHCAEPVGALCTLGKCQTVSREGPCTSDADCVLAVDFTSLEGTCCGCTEVVSKAFEAVDSCVELEGATKPANCTLVGGSCATVDCAVCAKPTPTCSLGRCVPG